MKVASHYPYTAQDFLCHTLYKGIEMKESLDCHFHRLRKFMKEDIDEQLMKGEGIDCGKERY